MEIVIKYAAHTHPDDWLLNLCCNLESASDDICLYIYLANKTYAHTVGANETAR
jgi:hypothetical protein